MEEKRRQEIAYLFLKTRFGNSSFPTDQFVEEKSKQIGIPITMLKYFFESLLKGDNWLTPEKQQEISLLFVEEICTEGKIQFTPERVKKISELIGVDQEEMGDFLFSVGIKF